MKKSVRNISLKVKIPLLFCALLFALIAAFGSILYVHYHRVFQQNYKESFQMAMTANANGIDGLLSEIESATIVINNNSTSHVGDDHENYSFVAKLVVDTNPDALDFDYLDMLEEWQFCSHLMSNLLHSSSSYALFVDDEYPISEYLSSRYKNQNGIYKAENAKSSEWYQAAEQLSGQTYWFTDQNYKNRLFLARQLSYKFYIPGSGYQTRPFGLILVGIDYKTLSEQIDITKMPDKTQIMVVDKTGTLLYSNQSRDTLLSEEVLTQAAQGLTAGDADYFMHNDTQYLIQKNIVADGLTMLTAIPAEAITSLSSSMLTMLLAVLAVTLVIGIVLINLLSRSIVSPIVKLSFQMKKGIIEQVDATRYADDEIGVLYRGYNELQESMRELLSNAWESAQKQKNAEMKMLQAQINPHFVYNTLSTISCQALLQGEDEIAEQINILTQIMRYSTRDPNSLVPLEKEIQIISQYLQIQKLNGKKIEHTLLIDDDCKNILIPKLMIQPLVENAIIHGIEPNQSDGRISVSAQFADNRVLTIRVCDNGRGGDVEAINRSIQEGGGDGLGIRNVCDRIRNVYGDSCELKYRITESGETEAQITVELG